MIGLKNLFQHLERYEHNNSMWIVLFALVSCYLKDRLRPMVIHLTCIEGRVENEIYIYYWAEEKHLKFHIEVSRCTLVN